MILGEPQKEHDIQQKQAKSQGQEDIAKTGKTTVQDSRPMDNGIVDKTNGNAKLPKQVYINEVVSTYIFKTQITSASCV